MFNTAQQYANALAVCKNLYLNKVKDYGTSWRILRTISIVDQIYIKAWRIRQIQEKGIQKVNDSIESEFIGIVNYSLIALIQFTLNNDPNIDLSEAEAATFYEAEATKIHELMLHKNHDYGEAWRNMSQQAMVDLILVKLLRIKQILAHDGKTMVSEGMDANFADIVNYGIFALIKITETKPITA